MSKYMPTRSKAFALALSTVPIIAERRQKAIANLHKIQQQNTTH
nr:MAG TPA: hypothetical protein [Caudoviricetes sp.]